MNLSTRSLAELCCKHQVEANVAHIHSDFTFHTRDVGKAGGWQKQCLPTRHIRVAPAGSGVWSCDPKNPSCVTKRLESQSRPRATFNAAIILYDKFVEVSCLSALALVS